MHQEGSKPNSVAGITLNDQMQLVEVKHITLLSEPGDGLRVLL